MQQITLNFDGIAAWKELYDFLKAELSVPERCRRDLDSIWRCLRGSFAQPTVLILENLTALPQALHPGIPVVRQMFRDLEAEEALLTVQIPDEAAIDALLAEPDLEPEEEPCYFF